MNLCKDSKNIKNHFTDRYFDVIHQIESLFLGFPAPLYKLSNFYIFYEGIFKKVEYPCIFNETEQSAEKSKKKQLYLLSYAHRLMATGE
jgi:hypothetical protein